MKTREATQDRLVGFYKRGQVDDGFGNPVSGDFAEVFREMAALIYAGGSEGLEAGRLEGRETLKVRVRANANTATISNDFQMRDIETGEDFGVLSVDHWTARGWVWLRVQSGITA